MTLVLLQKTKMFPEITPYLVQMTNILKKARVTRLSKINGNIMQIQNVMNIPLKKRFSVGKITNFKQETETYNK